MKNLVAYFSASGVTAKVANDLANVISADVFEIKPAVPYIKADLNWMDKKSRSSIEMADKSFRPEILNAKINTADYDTIYIGFPIWWYVAPTIINTFLEANDFDGKKIILFATSGSSGFGNTANELQPSAPNANIVAGEILNGNPSADKLKEFADRFGK